MIFVFLILIQGFFSQAMVESPKDCLQQESKTCYFGSVSKVAEYQVDENSKIYVGKNTVLEKSQGLYRFHEGEILLEVGAEFSMYLKKVKVDFLKGEYIIRNSDDRAFVVRTLQGEAQVSLREQRIVQVTEGFDLKLIDKGEGFEQAPLTVIPLEEHLLSYAKLRKMSKAEIIKYTQAFSKKYQNYTRWANELNDQLIQRQVAAQDEAEKQRKANEQFKKLQQEKIRKQLYEKAFER